MHGLTLVISAECYFSTAFYPDTEHVIWTKFAFCKHEQNKQLNLQNLVF